MSHVAGTVFNIINRFKIDEKKVGNRLKKKVEDRLKIGWK